MSTSPTDAPASLPGGPEEPNLDFVEGDPTAVEQRPENLPDVAETGEHGADAHPDSLEAGEGAEPPEDTAVDPHKKRQRDVEGHSPPGDYPEPSDDTSIA